MCEDVMVTDDYRNYSLSERTTDMQKTERNAAFDGDTCGRQCEGTAYRIEARQQKRRADALAATIRALQDVVTHDAETKADFIARVRAVLAADPDERLTHNACLTGATPEGGASELKR